MRKFKLFYIAFVLFLSLTGCYADRGQLENSNPHAEDQLQSEQSGIMLSYTALYEAIKNRELKKTIALLQEAVKGDKESDLMQRDDRGRSLLHFVVKSANLSQEVLYLEIVSLLIQLKQDVNARDNDANTPLHIAASKGLFFVAEELVKNGANIYAENEQGEIPLHCAAGEGNIKVVRLLIDQNKTVEKTIMPLILTGPDSYIDKKDKDGRTPLYLVMYRLRCCIDNPAFGNPEKYVFIVKLLVASGANVHTEDKYGTTLLHIAARAGCVEMVRMLLEEKVEVNHCDKNGTSPLELAICRRSVSTRAKDYLTVVNLLIEAGANVNQKDKYARNLLHRATILGNVEMVKLLIGHKAEINSEDYIGCTPLHVAAANRASSNAEILEQQCYLEVVDLLIQRGAMIDFENDGGYTPLQLAIRGGSDKVAIYLIKQGANINPTHSPSLLHDAIDFCYPDRKDAYITLIKYLISLGVGINNVDSQGNTPLHLATKKLWISGFQEVVNLLIEAGADIRAANNVGSIPFVYLRSYIREILL